MDLLNYENYLKESYSNYNFEYVLISTIWEYRDINRQEMSEFDNTKLPILMTSIQENGITEPFILQYSHKYKTCYLTEGNHRLLACIKLGIKHVPIRVTIDGYENPNAHKVIGYYASKNDKVQVSLPSEIGIPNCLDNNMKPVKSETRIFEEEYKDIDLSIFPDVKYYEHNGMEIIDVEYEGYWKTYDLFESSTLEYLEHYIEDYNFLEGFGNDLYHFMDTDHLLSNEMKSKLNIENLNEDEFEEYFYDYFSSSEYYDNYLKEIARVVWEKLRKENMDIIQYSSFETAYDGFVSWIKKLNSSFPQNVTGLQFKDELIEEYEYNNDRTFKELLKNNYTIGSKITIDFIDPKKYDNTIKAEELNISNIIRLS